MNQTHSRVQKVQTTPSLPRRFLKKELPRIAEKIIPFHNLEIKQEYHGKIDQLLIPQQWAYIPSKAHKQSNHRRVITQESDLQFKKMTSHSSDHFRSTSKVFLKNYLKRKKMKELKQSRNITNYVGLFEDKRQNSPNFLQGIIQIKQNRLQKYRSQASVMEKMKDKITNLHQTNQQIQIDEFRQSKMRLKDKLKAYQTNIKNKKTFVKLADRRYKNLQNIETINYNV